MSWKSTGRVVCETAIAIVLAGCVGGPTGGGPDGGGPGGTGLQNPSFEAASVSASLPASWTSGAVDSAGTVGVGCPTYSGNLDKGGARTTGTGFMPTSGSYYFSIPAWNLTTSIYQDNIDLSRAKTMLFDYSTSGTLTTSGGQFTVVILFQGDGTTTLWSREYTSATGVAAVEKRDESVTLPALPLPGRFIIRSTINCGSPPGPDTQTATLAIDNLRFQ